MKTGEKNRFLLCFRPVAMDGAIKSDCKDRSSDPVFTYVAVSSKDDLMIPAILSPVPEKKRSKSKVSSERDAVGHSRKKNTRRILSRIAKAVFFETSVKKKVRDGKVRQDPYRSESNLLTKSEKISDDWKIGAPVSYSYLSSSNLISSSSFSSSSYSSSLASSWRLSESKRNSRCLSDRKKSFRSNSFEPKQSSDRSAESKQSSDRSVESKQSKTRKMTGKFNCSTGLYLLLISLLVLIFWGRLCAIICTSTWLYFVPSHRVSEDDPPVIDSPGIHSREYKKKVIMEGLLERNHRV